MASNDEYQQRQLFKEEHVPFSEGIWQFLDKPYFGMATVEDKTKSFRERHILNQTTPLEVINFLENN